MDAQAFLTPSEHGFRTICQMAICLAIVAPVFAAPLPAKPEPYIVDACLVPVYVQLRIAAHADMAERSYRIESCGSGRNLNHDIPDGAFEALSFTGVRGELDIRLRLHEGDKTLAYEALKVMPGASERTLQRIGHDDGPDVTIATARDPFRDLLALHVTNTPAYQVAVDIARTKQLHIDGIENFKKGGRVTFAFDAIPMATALQLLGEISDRDIVRTGERDYVVLNPPYRFPDGWKALAAARDKASKHDQAAIEDRMLPLVDTPKQREDIEPFQLGALRELREWAEHRHDSARVIAIDRRIVALLKLRSYDTGRDTVYADALSQLADALEQHGDTSEASTLLAQAVAIIERADGPQSPSLVKPLLQQVTLAQRQGTKDSVHDQLARAVALADPEDRLLALLQLASLQAEEGHYGDAATTLDRSYPLQPKKYGRWYDENDREDPFKIGSQFVNLESKVIQHLPVNQAEFRQRRLVAVETLRFGADSFSAAYETYALGRNLLLQEKFDAAAKEFESSLNYAAKQPEPPFYFADALQQFATIQLKQRDFAGTAHTWQDMAALRAKVYGSHHARVALAFREVAMLDVLADRSADVQNAARAADEAEAGKHASRPLPPFAKAADDLKDGLAFDLVGDILEQLRVDTAKLTTLDDRSRVRDAALALQLEALAQTELRVQNDNEIATFHYILAAELLGLSRGRDDAQTRRATRRADELCDRFGQKGMAQRLCQSMAMERWIIHTSPEPAG